LITRYLNTPCDLHFENSNYYSCSMHCYCYWSLQTQVLGVRQLVSLAAEGYVWVLLVKFLFYEAANYCSHNPNMLTSLWNFLCKVNCLIKLVWIALKKIWDALIATIQNPYVSSVRLFDYKCYQIR